MPAILSGPEVRHKHPAINFRTRFYPSHLFFASLREILAYDMLKLQPPLNSYV